MAREAFELAESIEASSDRTVFNRLNALVVIGRVRARRGEPRAWQSLDAALELAEQIGELQRVAPVRSARAEAAWLDNDHERAAAEATPAYKLAVEKGHVWFAAEPALWLWRSEQLFELPIALPPPFAAHVAGDPTTAAQLWEQVGCPYEQADALADTDDVDSVRRSLEIAQSLGARPLAARAVGRLRRLGARPASPRPASRLT
ncbi:MAG: hypothetical protein JOZ81_28455 [Chloroflexi bacterium]|nr:hypothetical protein [Chloroflexota bacterium]